MRTHSGIELGALTTTVSEAGEGADLLWIAGGGYFGSAWHEHFVPHFVDRFRNLTFDARGTDGTGCTDALPWSIADMARDASVLLERFATGPATVVGHSMGGAIGLQLALDRPDLIARVLVLASGADTATGWAGDFMRAEIALRRAGVRLSTEFSTVHYAPLLYPADALGDPAAWTRIKASLSDPSFHDNNEDTIESQWQACAEFDVRARMPRLAVPVDFVAFEQDVSAPPELGRSSADLSPLARYHEIPGLGHCSLFGHRPEAVSAALDRILSAEPEQRRGEE
ncbi:alpha/beta fold hydrolase [Rhodococcus koreensis]